MADTPGERTFPTNWLIAQDYDPNAHLIQLKGKEYLDVQNRLLWFIRDQRALIAKGLATTHYVVKTEEVEHDRERSWANYKTYVRDVLGNESTMYGSESARDFPDYAEKASTKSLGRALLCLGYGTGMAPELDEGERVVDSPRPARQQQQTAQPSQASQRNREPDHVPPPKRLPPATAPSPTGAAGAQPVTDSQMVSLERLTQALRREAYTKEQVKTFQYARDLIQSLTEEFKAQRAGQAHVDG